MLGKVICFPVTGIAQSALRSSIEQMVCDSIANAGHTIRTYDSMEDLDDATHLLVPGVGSWGGDTLTDVLAEAGKLGIRRVLWQLETLPPPDLPQSLMARFLLRRTPYRVTGVDRLMDKLALNRLAAQCEKLECWKPGEIDQRRLGLPVREARRIKALWRGGLLNKILVSLESRQQFLRSIGVESDFMPFGYHRTWGYPLDDLERDLDVVVIGTPTPRRRSLLTSLKSAVTRAGYGFTVIEGSCYGDERNRILNRSKIFLHLRNYPWELPRMRIMMAMGCKSLFVTEQFDDTRPFLPGEHFIMAPPESLAERIIACLRDDETRQRITEASYKYVTGELDLGRLLVEAL